MFQFLNDSIDKRNKFVALKKSSFVKTCTERIISLKKYGIKQREIKDAILKKQLWRSETKTATFTIRASFSSHLTRTTVFTESDAFVFHNDTTNMNKDDLDATITVVNWTKPTDDKNIFASFRSTILVIPISSANEPYKTCLLSSFEMYSDIQEDWGKVSVHGCPPDLMPSLEACVAASSFDSVNVEDDTFIKVEYVGKTYYVCKSTNEVFESDKKTKVFHLLWLGGNHLIIRSESISKSIKIHVLLKMRNHWNTFILNKFANFISTSCFGHTCLFPIHFMLTWIRFHTLFINCKVRCIPMR
jgi:hypothetical protein